MERAFRSLEHVDLQIRPIHYRLENRERVHLFLCMLAYHLEWHLRRAWEPQHSAEKVPNPHAGEKDADAMKVMPYRDIMRELAACICKTSRFSQCEKARLTLYSMPSPL